MPSVFRTADQSVGNDGEEYQAKISYGFHQQGEPGFVRIAFRTNPEGLRKQFFRVMIKPIEFEALAHEMMKADPASAIRAFGAAMQDFQKERPN